MIRWGNYLKAKHDHYMEWNRMFCLQPKLPLSLFTMCSDALLFPMALPMCDSDILSTPSWAWSVKLSTKTDVTCIFSFFSQGERGLFISLRQHFVTEDCGGAGQPWMRQAKPPQLCRGQNCGHQFEDPSQQGWFCWEGGNACLYEIFKCINFGWFSVSCLLWPQWERH